MRRYLNGLGIRPQQTDPLHRCAYEDRKAWIATWDGRRYRCFRKLEKPPNAELRSKGKLRSTFILANETKCHHCPAAPLCSVQCPLRLRTSDHGDCLTRVRQNLLEHFKAELTNA
jgi:radical SAM protein with 4Fe4S-binding SPASM domain